MSVLLDYERPLHIEHRLLPRKIVPIVVGASALLTMLPFVERLILRHRLGGGLIVVESIVPVVAAAALLTMLNCSVMASVFADRLEITLFIVRFKIWSRRVPLATLTEAAVVRNAHPPGQRKFTVLRRSPGLVVVMFGGKGLKLVSADRFACWLGSDDPDRLLAAIESAKQSGYNFALTAIDGAEINKTNSSRCP